MYVLKRAVVIGAGIGGLTAAQALAGKFEEVLILEENVSSNAALYRTGVPQGKHPHFLLAGGLEALNLLFDDITASLLDAGAVESDMGNVSYDFPGQETLPQRALGIPLLTCTRPLLEAVLRDRLQRRKDIRLLEGRRVVEIFPTADWSSVKAVRCQTREHKDEIYEAELVVDASSRGDSTIDFLRSTGRPLPPKTTIGVDYSYLTANLEFPEGGEPAFQMMMALPNAPYNSRTGKILVQEKKKILALIGGRGEDAPPLIWPAFVNYVSTLVSPNLGKALANAVSYGKPRQFLFRESRRRHYERILDWPDGLIPIADAICRVNPVYGHGMAAASKEAVVLRDLMEQRQFHPQPQAGFFKVFMNAVNPMLDDIWLLSAIPDLAYADTRGSPPDNLWELLSINIATHRAAILDADIHKLLFEVISLLKPSSELRKEAVAEKISRLANQLHLSGKHANP